MATKCEEEQDITKFLGAYVSKCGYANAILFGHKFRYLLACKVYNVMKWNTQVQPTVLVCAILYSGMAAYQQV